MIAPGSTIGILGGGQLGRMLTLAGRKLGYRFHIFEPKGPCTAGMVADLEINAEYSNRAALKQFAEGVDVITLEFENIPYDASDLEMAERVKAASDEIMEICVEGGGTITGEPGVGLDKREHMRLLFSERELELQRAVKRAVDPNGLASAAKLFPPPPAADGSGDQ